jgi:hypothetical protein
VVTNICEAEDDVFAYGATRYNAWTLHIEMCFGEAPFCTTVRALSFRRSNVRVKYLAQFAGSSITVDVGVGFRVHL